MRTICFAYKVDAYVLYVSCWTSYSKTYKTIKSCSRKSAGSVLKAAGLSFWRSALDNFWRKRHVHKYRSLVIYIQYSMKIIFPCYSYVGFVSGCFGLSNIIWFCVAHLCLFIICYVILFKMHLILRCIFDVYKFTFWMNLYKYTIRKYTISKISLYL